MTVFGSETRNENKMVDCKLHKYKNCWCIWGDQQDYKIEDSYAPVLKATKACLLVAICSPTRSRALWDRHNAGVSLWHYGWRWGCLCEAAWVVFRPSSGGTCVPTQEGNLLDHASSSQMAHAYLNLDGGVRVPSGKQWRDNLHEADRWWLHYPWIILIPYYAGAASEGTLDRYQRMVSSRHITAPGQRCP